MDNILDRWQDDEPYNHDEHIIFIVIDEFNGRQGLDGWYNIDDEIKLEILESIIARIPPM